MFNENKKYIVITDYNNKVELGNILYKSDKLIDIKYMTLAELTKLITFTLDDIWFYKYNKDNYYFLKNIEKYLYYITEDQIETKRLATLSKIVFDLQEKNLITTNELSINYLKTRKVVFYNTYADKHLKGLLNRYNIDYDEISSKKDVMHSKLDIVEFDSMYEEVNYLFYKISSLLESGININKIKVHANSIYNNLLDIFSIKYKLPIDMNRNVKINTFDIYKDFINEVKGSNEGVEKGLNNIINKLSSNTKLNINQDILALIKRKLTKYIFIEDPIFNLIEIFKQELANVSIVKNKQTDVIKVSDFTLSNVYEDDHLFILGINKDVIYTPKIESDFLSEEEKTIIGFKTALDVNSYNLLRLKSLVLSNKNVYLSKFIYHNQTEYFDSELLDVLKEEVEVTYINDSINNSTSRYSVSQDILSASFNKYNLDYTSEILNSVMSLYVDKFKKHDNSYNQISHETFMSLTNGQVNLSHSSTANFYKCNFRYYLANILKLDSYEDPRLPQHIGNVIHKCLEIIDFEQENDFDLDALKTIYQDYVDEFIYELTKMDDFYINKTLASLVEFIENLFIQYNKSKFVEYGKEVALSYDIQSNDLTYDFKFKGFIDKLLIDDNYNAVIVDYKTGYFSNMIKYSLYGFNNQLINYKHLLENTKLFQNFNVVGMFYQQTTSFIPKLGPSEKDIETQILEHYKLEGKLLNDEDIIEKIDINYHNGSFIKGVKTKKDGSLASSEALLSLENFKNLAKANDELIKNAVNDINNRDFKINPKTIFGAPESNYGCSYCDYNDVCYKKQSDVIQLEKLDRQKDMFEKLGDKYGV